MCNKKDERSKTSYVLKTGKIVDDIMINYSISKKDVTEMLELSDISILSNMMYGSTEEAKSNKGEFKGSRWNSWSVSRIKILYWMMGEKGNETIDGFNANLSKKDLWDYNEKGLIKFLESNDYFDIRNRFIEKMSELYGKLKQHQIVKDRRALSQAEEEKALNNIQENFPSAVEKYRSKFEKNVFDNVQGQVIGCEKSGDNSCGENSVMMEKQSISESESEPEKEPALNIKSAEETSSIDIVTRAEEKIVSTDEKEYNETKEMAKNFPDLYKGYSKVKKKNTSQAIEYLQKSAVAGNAEALYLLGNKYRYGVDLDFEKAVECYKKASKLNHAQAIYELGKAYKKGEGIKKSLEEAKKCFYEAAVLGNADALGEMSAYYYKKECLGEIGFAGYALYEIARMKGGNFVDMRYEIMRSSGYFMEIATENSNDKEKRIKFKKKKYRDFQDRCKELVQEYRVKPEEMNLPVLDIKFISLLSVWLK